MSHSLTPGLVADGASGLVLIALAVLVLAARPQGRANVAFAAFAGAHGLGIAVSNFLSAHWKDTLWISAAAYVVAAAGLLTFVLAWPRRASRRDAPLVAVAAAAALAWATLYAGAEAMGFRSYHYSWYPELGRSAVTMAENLGYTLILATYLLAFALVSLRFTQRASRHEPEQRQLALVAAAMCAFPAAYVGSQSLAFGTGDQYAGFLGLGVTVALSALWLRHAALTPYRVAATGVALVALGAALLGMAVAAWVGGHAAAGDTGLFGVVRSVAALYLAYALVRRQLLGVDLRVKRTLREGTAVGTLVGAYLVVSLTAELFLEGRTSRVLGVVATAVLLLAIVPLRRFGARVADAVMPDVSDSSSYLDGRKLEVYRSALAEALAPDGSLPPRRASFLAHLRGELGLTERDHVILLHALAPAAGAGGDDGRVLLGRYRVRECLGRGAFGATHLADDLLLARTVAVKEVTPRAGDPDAVLREARAASAVRHPGVVVVHDVAMAASGLLIVMEHVEAGSLKDRVARGPLPPPEFLQVGLDLLDALAAVHAVGIVHRDVKPSNVLLTRDGRAKLADFGVSRAAAPAGDATATAGGGGAPAGTFRYMAPEQARGEPATTRSDLYSAAATLYEAWTGRPYLEPRPAESALELQTRAASVGAFDKPLTGPRALRDWFARALAPAAWDRFPDARSMREGLDRALAMALL